MARLNPEIDHLLRRAGFGVSAAEVDTYKDMSFAQAVVHLVDYEGSPDDVDERIGRPDHARVIPSETTKQTLFSPDIDIDDAAPQLGFLDPHEGLGEGEALRSGEEVRHVGRRRRFLHRRRRRAAGSGGFARFRR